MDMIKNLKVTPTSQILLADYRGDISLKDKDVSRAFMRRLEKKYKLRADTIDKIIQQDYEVFSKRGDNVRDYAFCQDTNVYDRLDIVYDYIQPQEHEQWFLVTKRFLNFTFSELAVSIGIFCNLETFHNTKYSKLQKMNTDYQTLSNEENIRDYYRFLKLAARCRLLQKIDHNSSVVRPSFKDVTRALTVVLYENPCSVLSQEWNTFKQDSDSYDKEMQLIKKHSNMEQIYKNRRL